MSHLSPAASSQPNLQQRPQRAQSVLPFSLGCVFLLCRFCSVLALPLSLCLLSISLCLPLFAYAPVSGYTIGLCPINSDNNGPVCLFDWIVPECGSSEFTLAASANLAVLSESQTLAVCFPSAPTSRVRREWIPAQSVPAKHRYLIEGGNTVIDTKQRARDSVSLLDFCNAHASSSQILQCVCACERERDFSVQKSRNMSHVIFLCHVCSKENPTHE